MFLFMAKHHTPALVINPFKKKSKTSKARQLEKISGKGTITEKTSRYDAGFALANATFGLSFVQSLRGDPPQAENE